MAKTLSAKRIYGKKYDNEVITYMDNLFKMLTKQYGSVLDEWRVSLDLIAFNYNLIRKCEKDIETNGFTKQDERGRMQKNPAFAICNSAQGHLIKLLSSFGLNLLSKAKLKEPDNDDGLDDLLA